MPPLALEQLLQLVRVDARHGDVRADAVDHQRQQQEDKPATQVAELAALGQIELRWLPRSVRSRSGRRRRSGQRAAGRLDGSLGAGGRADALDGATFAVSSPRLDDLDGLRQLATRPACLERQQVDLGARALQSAVSVISSLNFSEADLKPRLGRRRCSGIWPPSKPTFVVAARTRLLALCGRGRRSCPGRADAAADAARACCPRRV